MLKERVKSLALFLLFALSIYLMKELWASDLILTFNNDSESTYSLADTASIIEPQTITYGFGADVYGAVFVDRYDTWAVVKSNLKTVLDQSIKIETIDKRVYDEARLTRSLEIHFAFPMTLRDLTEVVNSGANQRSTDTQMLQDLLFVSGENTLLYIRAGEAYAVLKSENPMTLLEQEILEAENNETTYFKTVEGIYKIQKLLSSEMLSVPENRQLLPVGKAESLPVIAVVPEYNIGDDGVLRSLVTQFFGTHIVKKLVDIDGSLVYLYGYGEKTLKVSQNGGISFKSKIQNVPLKTVSLLEALQLSLNFMDRFGGIPENLKFKNYTYEVQEDIPVYHLSFSLMVADQEVVAETTSPGIQITLIGEQVTEYDRFILNPVSELKSDRVQSDIQTVDFLINTNFEETISPNYISDHPEIQGSSLQAGSRNILFHILQSMAGFEPLYYLNETNYQALIPVWKIGFDQYLYYFDLNTGQIIKTERKAE